MKKILREHFEKKLKEVEEDHELTAILNEAVSIISLLEYNIYKKIPKTASYYRLDNGKINKSTLKHAVVYADPKGNGKELYAVNIDGSGHDGSSGKKISNTHANYFRSLGFSIPDDNILENLCLSSDDLSGFEISVLLD